MSIEFNNELISKSIPKLYLDRASADVEFIFEEDAGVIPAHKAIYDVFWIAERRRCRENHRYINRSLHGIHQIFLYAKCNSKFGEFGRGIAFS